MRVIKKPSTANCDIETYVRYLLSEPLTTSCTGLAGIMPDISHDSVNRFLIRENYTGEDLRKKIKGKINLSGGILSVDDMVLDKPYSDANKTDFIGYFYSGKHHRVVKGVNIITLFYTDPSGVSVPLNFKIIDPSEDKTKNELFRDMLQELLSWGLKPKWITGDCWYSSIENLKFIRKYKLEMVFGIESNRKISLIKGSYLQVQKIQNWSQDGVIVYLKGYGMVKVFRQECNDSFRYYMMALPIVEKLNEHTKEDFSYVHGCHWNIENFHRATKQLCSIEKFQVRTTSCVQNHIFCSFIGFIKLELARSKKFIANWYHLKRQLFVGVIRKFLLSGIDGLEQSQLLYPVNA